MKVLFKKTAGIDVHKKIMVVTIRTIDDLGNESKQTQEFNSFKQGLFQLQDWLLKEKVEMSVMESTSVYWKPAYEILEDAGIPIILVNARHIKSVPGRKTDIQDSEWLATLASYGLLRASFIPPKDFREIRLLTRYRRKLSQVLASEKNRLQKILEDCGIKLSCVVSDVDGVSARKMIEALIENQIKPDEIVKLAMGQLKKKQRELLLSLDSTISDRHRFLLSEIQDHIKVLKTQLKTIDEQVGAAMRLYQEQWQLLQTIPGLDKIGAAILLAEIGVDMAAFGSRDRLCCWAGLSPGNNQSAGKRKSGKTPKGNQYTKTLLCEIANCAIRTKSQFKSRYEGLKIRRGHKKAIIAIGHKILEVAHILLQKKVPYKDPSIDYEKLVVERNAPRWIKMLKKHDYLQQNIPQKKEEIKKVA